MTSKPNTLLLWLAIMASTLLASCDGGLFGTGDGIVIDPSETGDEMMVVPTGDVAAIEFNNQLPTSSIADTQLRAINTTTFNLDVVANDESLNIVDDLQPLADSGLVSLPAATTSVKFVNTDLAAPSIVYTLSPFNAVASSITTVIARSDQNNDVNVVALSTQSSTTDQSTALVRLVQSNTLGDATELATMTLQAVQPNPSGSDSAFNNLSFDTAATDYAVVMPGTYVLNDSEARFSDENITIEANKVYTLLINGTTAPVLIVIDDTE